MTLVTVTVKHRIPKGLYCNHTMQRSTPTTRCRFCTDLTHSGTKAGYGFVCVLHNLTLTTNGLLINKAHPCLAKVNLAEDAPLATPQEIAKNTLDKYIMVYNGLVGAGIAMAKAEKLAIAEAMKGFI